MTFRILPKDPKFFELFVLDGDNLAAAATALHEMVDAYDKLESRVANIQTLEKRGDEIDDEVNRRLEDAFVTPFDREDIHELGSRLDEVVGAIHAMPQAFAIYGAHAPSPASSRSPRHSSSTASTNRPARRAGLPRSSTARAASSRRRCASS